MKLLRFLDSLSAKSRHRFLLYLQSPYVNQKTELPTLYQALIEDRYTLRLDLDKERIWRRSSDTASFTDTRFRLRISEIYKHLERFLALENFHEGSDQSTIALLSQLRSLELYDDFERKLQRVRAHARDSGRQDAAVLSDRLTLMQMDYEHRKTLRLSEFNLQEYADLQEVVYISQKLRHACLMLSHARLTKSSYDYGMIDYLISYIQERELMQYPAIALYHHFYLIASGKGDDLYQEYQELLFEHIDGFPLEEQQDFVIGAINYCIARINRGEDAYSRHLLELYQEGIENKILFTDGRLSRFTYRNAAAIGIKLDELEWVAQFIEEKKQFLDPRYADSIYRFNKARLLYHSSLHDQALDQLYHTDYEDQILSLAAQTLKMKIYYEQQEDALLESFMDSTEKAVRRMTKLGYHRENYLKVLRYTRLVHRAYDRAGLDQIKAKIIAEESLLERRWLLARIALKSS